MILKIFENFWELQLPPKYPQHDKFDKFKYAVLEILDSYSQEEQTTFSSHHNTKAPYSQQLEWTKHTQTESVQEAT